MGKPDRSISGEKVLAIEEAAGTLGEIEGWGRNKRRVPGGKRSGKEERRTEEKERPFICCSFPGDGEESVRQGNMTENVVSVCEASVAGITVLPKYGTEGPFHIWDLSLGSLSVPR